MPPYPAVPLTSCGCCGYGRQDQSEQQGRAAAGGAGCGRVCLQTWVSGIVCMILCNSVGKKGAVGREGAGKCLVKGRLLKGTTKDALLLPGNFSSKCVGLLGPNL